MPWQFNLHATGILLSSVVVVSTGGPRSPFVLLYLCLFVAVAGGWGLRRMLLPTAAGTLLLLFGTVTSAEWLHRTQGSAAAGSSVNGVLSLSAGLILSSYVFGMLLRRDRRRLAHAMVIAELTRNVLSKSSLKTSMEYLLQAVRQYLDAD